MNSSLITHIHSPLIKQYINPNKKITLILNMLNNDDYKLSCWGSLWKYFGIDRHTYYGFHWVMAQSKLADFRDWCMYQLGITKYGPPLCGEPKEDFYIRKIYSTSYDCFNRPILGAPTNHITIGLREEVPIETTKHLVLKPGATREAINFGSYNYLGFGGPHPVTTANIINTLKTTGSNVSGFASERGISNEQEKLESMIAEFLHKDAAVVVPMGFATNSTLIPILVGKGDVILSDALNHSSLITGMKSSNAEVEVFKHNDMIDLKRKLEHLKTKGMRNGKQPKKVLVVVEGLYSMEGEFCKLREIIALKKAYGFYLYVDEAHSICALGATGRGITEQLGCDFNDVDILMGTFSKSFAAAGGYIASDRDTIELLRSNCFAHVYGNPMSPVEAMQIISCLKLIDSEEGRRRIAQLRKSSINLRTRLISAGCHVLGDLESPVIPVMLYHPGKIKDLSRACLKRGVAIVVVGFPACPLNAVRIRFCISAAHTDEDIDKAFNVTMEAMKESSCVYGDTPQPSSIYHAPHVDLKEYEALPKQPRVMPKLSENSDGRVVRTKALTPSGFDACCYDIHDFNNDEVRQNRLIKTINYYGCGSCGPRGFYGTTLEHLDLETKLAKFYNTNCAVTYSYGNNTMTSCVTVYGHVGNVLLVDEYCNYPIQIGCKLSKAKTIKFKHNDINDLKAKLAQAQQTIKSNCLISIITEGVFQYDYSIAPLKEMSKLRTTNVQLIVDDSIGIGSIGANLKGTIEYLGLTMNDIDILAGSLEFVAHTIGGFVVGKYSLIDKQRLFGGGYVFSASSPPFSCTAAIYALEQFEKEGSAWGIELAEKRKRFGEMLKQKAGNYEVVGNEVVPFVLLNRKNGKNDDTVSVLREKGFYVVKQQHLTDDWCQSEYIKVNLSKNFTEDAMSKFVDVLAKQ